MIEEYPDQEQRSAICYSQLRKERGEKTAPPTEEMLRDATKTVVWIGKLDESPDLDWLPEDVKDLRPLITGRAIHPIKTFHPSEWISERVYLEEELARAAPGFVGTTPYLDHFLALEGWNVVATKYEDGELKYAVVPKEGRELEAIRSGVINQTSIEFDWMVPGGGLKYVDGVAPYGFKPLHISFLEKMKAGDPSTTVHLWENKIVPGIKTRSLDNIKEGLVDMEKNPTDDKLGLEERLEWSLLKDRAIILHGQTDEYICQKVSRRLEFLGRESKDPIHIILNSVGGSVYDGLLVFDTIKNLTAKGIPVVCEARGLAASMGCIILQAGTKRLATPHTRLLIHEVSSWQWGETTQLEEQTEELRKLNSMLNQIIAERTGKTVEEIGELTKKTDYWMSAQEALDFGLVDEIVQAGSPTFESVRHLDGRIREYSRVSRMNKQKIKERIEMVEAKVATITNLLEDVARSIKTLKEQVEPATLTGDDTLPEISPEVPITTEAACKAAGGEWDAEHNQCLQKPIVPVTDVQAAKEPPIETRDVAIAEATTKEECESAGGTWNAESETCKMPEPTESVGEQGEPKSDAERAKAHFNISDEDWEAMSEEERQAKIDALPPVGSKRVEEAVPTTKDACEAAGGTWNAESKTCKLPEPVTEAIGLRKKLFKANQDIASIRSQKEAVEDQSRMFRESIEATLPDKMVWRNWSFGPQTFLKKVRKTLGLNPEA